MWLQCWRAQLVEHMSKNYFLCGKPGMQIPVWGQQTCIWIKATTPWFQKKQRCEEPPSMTQSTSPSNTWCRPSEQTSPAGLGLPLMIIWLLHNEALQLSGAQTLKWQQPPTTSSSSSCRRRRCPDLLLSATCCWSASLLCHLTQWTPDTEPPQEQRGPAAAYRQQTTTTTTTWTTDACSDVHHSPPLYLDISQACWVGCKKNSFPRIRAFVEFIICKE